MALSSFTRAYNSIGGVDIQAVVGSKVLGSLQGISYQVSREKAPIYTLGSADPRAFGRGKRAIAGSLVFIQFDEDPVLGDLNLNRDFIADIDELRPEYIANEAAPISETTINPVGGSSSVNAPGVAAQSQESDISSVGEDMMLAKAWYADQILPFDVILTAVNEYGVMTLMKILGIELMNQGFGISIDDIVAEHSYTYIATGLVPWTALGVHPDIQNRV